MANNFIKCEDLSNSNVFKNINYIGKNVQSAIYDNLKFEYVGGGERLFGDKKSFIYDLEKNSIRRRKK